MTLIANHPLLARIALNTRGKLLHWCLLIICLLPLAVFGQENVNPLTVDTAKQTQPPTSILKIQFEKASDLERKKDYKKAIEAYTMCIDNAPASSDVLKFALSRRATCYFKQKTYDLCLHDASQVPITVPKVFVMMSSADAVRATVQYDHDAYILAGVCKIFMKPGLGCDDFKNALKIETFIRYKGEKNANTFIQKYCK